MKIIQQKSNYETLFPVLSELMSHLGVTITSKSKCPVAEESYRLSNDIITARAKSEFFFGLVLLEQTLSSAVVGSDDVIHS